MWQSQSLRAAAVPVEGEGQGEGDTCSAVVCGGSGVCIQCRGDTGGGPRTVPPSEVPVTELEEGRTVRVMHLSDCAELQLRSCELQLTVCAAASADPTWRQWRLFEQLKLSPLLHLSDSAAMCRVQYAGLVQR